MEDVDNSAAQWKLKLISHDPYPLVDPIGSKKLGLEIFYPASFDRILPVWLEPQVD